MKTYSYAILSIILTLPVGTASLAQEALTDVTEGRDLTSREVQTLFSEAGGPEFEETMKFLTDRGFELFLGEMAGGILLEDSSSLMLTIPFGSTDETPLGYAVYKDAEWSIFRFPWQDQDGEAYTVSMEQGTVAITNRPDLVPEVHISDLGKSNKAAGSCAYIGRARPYWACIGDSNPFGWQSDIYVRSGAHNPTSPNWYACWWGSIHVCPNPQTSFQVFPVCGFPPSHPAG